MAVEAYKKIDPTNYRNSDDPRYLSAAELGILSLQECIIWCQYIIKKCQEDPNYSQLIHFVAAPSYDIKIAGDYIQLLREAINIIGFPDKSTPEQRHNARMLIAQVRSWEKVWNDGEAFRDKIYPSGDIPPTLWNAYEYTSPSVIPTIVVPAEIIPGYDPFADGPS